MLLLGFKSFVPMNHINLGPFGLLGLLFNGWLGKVGLPFTLLGLYLIAVQIGNINNKESRLSSGETERAMATTLIVDNIGYSENDWEWYHVVYRIDIGERTYYGDSYIREDGLTDGPQMPVNYLKSDPDVSVLVGGQGYKIKMVGVVFGIIFLVAGIIMSLFAIKRFRRVISIIGDYGVSPGSLKYSEPTNMTVNDVPVMRYLYEYHDADGRPYVNRQSTTHQHDKYEEEETIIYAASDPENSSLLKNVPRFIARKIMKRS